VSLASTIAAPVGIFGGTFDPVHFGHLRPALEVLEELELAEVRLIPCHVPPHRDEPQAHADHRLELLRIAVSQVPGLRVDERELDRPGPSYTVDTLIDLRQELPDTPLCLMIGMDSLLGLPAWHRWRELIELAHLVVLARPGYEPSFSGELAEWIDGRRAGSKAALGAALNGAVYFHPVTQLDISATGIRHLIRSGRVPRFLTPDAVWRQIVAQRLYGWAGKNFYPQSSTGDHDQG
jgi:nicotinate-nucleotide adenylyltransferase